MILNAQRLQEIVAILDKQIALWVATTHGKNFLTDDEVKVLGGHKIVDGLYDQYKDHVWLNFQLGLISEALQSEKVKYMSFSDFKHFIAKGNYIPLTPKEEFTINSVKAQSLADIRAFKGRIFQDINQVVQKENFSVKADQEEFIREEIIEGLKNRDNVKKIISNLGHKTGDWSRDWSKSVEYICHSALNEGKAAMINKKAGGDGTGKVYFVVQPTACEHCKRLYLHPDGSPRIFTIAQLEANGSNIGRKAADWLPTIHSIHPFCRCLMQEVSEGYEWSQEKQKFTPAKNQHIVGRAKVKITIGDKTIYV